MAYGFWGTIEEFISSTETSCFSNKLSRQRILSGACALSPGEENVWRTDSKKISNLFRQLPIDLQKNIFIACEYDIPGHLGRCDAVLVGMSLSKKLSVLIFEFKSWKSFSYSEEGLHIKINGDMVMHPSLQCDQYCNRMKLFHEYSINVNILSAVIMTELKRKQLESLKSKAFSYKSEMYSLHDDSKKIIDLILEQFSNTPAIFEVKNFVNAKCITRINFAKKLFERLPHITSGITDALTSHLLDLSPQQENIISEILYAINENKQSLILVYGSPGSGKTVIGLHSIIHQMARQTTQNINRSIFVLRNNRLCTVIRSAIDDCTKPGIGKALVQYIKGGAKGVGLYYEIENAIQKNKILPIYDLVVVDEAHRLPAEPNLKLSQLESVLLSGKTIVCLLDEKQALNPDDNGSIENIKSIWNKRFRDAKVIEYELNEQYRLPISYSNWIDSFLNGHLLDSPSDYEIYLAKNESEVISFLKEKAENGNSCGILASYTKCNGRFGNDLRMPSLGIKWLMTPQEYNEWWRNKKIRHQFNRCASVYGCQGFELDYAGIFWGNDLCFKITDNIDFFICKNNDITDDIGQAYGKKLHTRVKEAISSSESIQINKVINDLKNRYRILLSRAKKGLIIYCENINTKNQFAKILNLYRP